MLFNMYFFFLKQNENVEEIWKTQHFIDIYIYFWKILKNKRTWILYETYNATKNDLFSFSFQKLNFNEN